MTNSLDVVREIHEFVVDLFQHKPCQNYISLKLIGVLLNYLADVKVTLWFQKPLHRSALSVCFCSIFLFSSWNKDIYRIGNKIVLAEKVFRRNLWNLRICQQLVDLFQLSLVKQLNFSATLNKNEPPTGSVFTRQFVNPLGVIVSMNEQNEHTLSFPGFGDVYMIKNAPTEFWKTWQNWKV